MRDNLTDMTKRVDTVSNGVDKLAGPTGPTKANSSAPNEAGAAIAPFSGMSTETLDSILQKTGRLAPLEALRYLTPLISVLGDLHAAKQAHGALSLDLVRVTKGADEALRLQLLKARPAPLVTRDTGPKTAVAGKMLLYSSPEQIQGATPNEFDDMYAIGHMAYTLIVGEPYWAEEADRLGFMAFCKTILAGLPEAPSVRAMRRKNLRLPQDFDAWFVLITDRKHADRFPDITDAGIALTSVLSNPDIRELSRSVQFKFHPGILDLPAAPPLPPPEPENLRFTAAFTIIASVCLALAIVLLLRWSNAHEPSPNTAPRQTTSTATESSASTPR
jgi:eukaryotic-like serine/threonine-protein kinase